MYSKSNNYLLNVNNDVPFKEKLRRIPFIPYVIYWLIGYTVSLTVILSNITVSFILDNIYIEF